MSSQGSNQKQKALREQAHFEQTTVKTTAIKCPTSLI
jgi:hypothetical protein